MVCVPCFIVPVLLFLWYKFISSYVLRFWNPWAVKDADGNVKGNSPFECEGGDCACSGKEIEKNEESAEAEQKGDLNTTSSLDRLKAD